MSKFYFSESAAESTASSGAHSPTSLAPLDTVLPIRPKHALTPFSETTEPNTAEDSDLPYPLPLSRSAFSNPAFDALTYLSTLKNRHQTLEDLRADLRTLSHDLARELTDLVNDEYETFLSVGDTLIGGEERVQEARLRVLGFKREIVGIREWVCGREREVEELLQDRRRVRKELALGRRLLRVHERVEALERAVAGDDSEDEDGLMPNVVALLRIEQAITPHPFLDTLAARIKELRRIILLDLDTAVRKRGDDTLDLLKLYAALDESKRAVRVLNT